VVCDRNRLNRVVINLVGNAMKFTPEGGSVTVTLKQVGFDGQSAANEFLVRDTGIGMSPDFVPRVFIPFERERTSTDSGETGTGLGLPIAKAIVDHIGGTIDVRSEVGKGTEFLVRFSLPVSSRPDDVPETERPGEAGEIDFTAKRILLVEDNFINMEIASMILADAGFQIEKAENGQEAVIGFARPGRATMT